MYIKYVNNIPEYTVTQLNRSIKELLEEKFDYIKLIGESGPITIANSGHVYFSIKENDEVISCICWKGTYERLEINLEEGTEYNFFGRVTSYSKFGRSVYQLIIDQVEYSGDGSILKLVEKINIEFLKTQFNSQSKVKVKNYIIDLNSREMEINNNKLRLTEKEINTIIYLSKSNKPVSVDELQEKVWSYQSDIETHTVETHIYRLRKKILNSFNDNEFIISKKNGYQIK